MTQHAAVLGSPIEHSLSPALHRAAYAELGIDATYEAMQVDRGGLVSFLQACDETWIGLSLTMPLKEEAVAIAAECDPIVTELGVANTLIPGPGGWCAYNTDVAGIVNAIGAVEADSAVVLGAGASARSALAALAALGVRDVELRARRIEQAQESAALATALGLNAAAREFSAATTLEDVDLCISTVPPHVADGVEVEGSCGTLLDIAYDPWPSKLAVAWLEHGGRVIAGHEMLLYQAVDQVRLMTGLVPDATQMRSAMEAELARRG